MNVKQGRAKPLSPDARRRAILAAVIPLLIEKGAAATTAEMAEAAGIAEGTIFRVFPDKAALIHAAVTTTMDPGPIRDALAGIPEDSPLELQLADATRVLTDRFNRMTALVGMLHRLPHPAKTPSSDSRRFAVESLAAISGALTTIMERHRDCLVVDPARAAVALRGLIFTNAHPLITPEEKLTVDEIVGVLLSGVVARGDTAG